LSRWRPARAGAAPVLAFLALAALPSPSSGAPAATLVDRVVAVVDEDPILLSDLEQAIGLGLVLASAGESQSALRRRTLDGLVEQMLWQHEIARFGFEEAPLAEVDRQLEATRARFPDDAAWRAELARLDLDEQRVRSLLAHQLSVLRFVEERLGPRVFVGVDEIREHYDRVLAPELRAAGRPVPPIEEVREAIRVVLKEERLNREIERWTAELRREADVVDYLEPDDRPLPPPVIVLPREE
jgi:peptidyl-prolyl cis-trans isomerase SurA